MLRRTIAAMLATGTAMLAGACGSRASASAPSGDRLTIGVTPTVLGVGETGQARASLSSGNEQTDATPSTAWQSSDPALASISGGGVVVALGSGRIDIRGFYQDVSATTSVRVLSAEDVQLTYALGQGGGLKPDGSIVWTMSVGQIMSLTPRAIYDRTSISSTIYDVLPRTRETWATSNAQVVAMTSPGQVTAVASGVADVTATWLGKTATVRITVL